MSDFNLLSKSLNNMVTNKANDDFDTDNYLFASITQPPIKIVDKNNSDDELKYTVECPNCGSRVIYGTDTYMLSGRIYCSNVGCFEKLINKIKTLEI